MDNTPFSNGLMFLRDKGMSEQTHGMRIQSLYIDTPSVRRDIPLTWMLCQMLVSSQSL